MGLFKRCHLKLPVLYRAIAGAGRTSAVIRRFRVEALAGRPPNCQSPSVGAVAGAPKWLCRFRVRVQGRAVRRGMAGSVEKAGAV